MSTSVMLLRFVGKAALNAVGAGVAGDFAFEVLPEVAQRTWDWWSADRNDAQRRAEVEKLAMASEQDVKQWVQQTVNEVASGQPDDVKQRLATYLVQVPMSIRQSLRRPTDPSGTTIPASLPLRKASDLLGFLPRKQTRFLPGQKPMPSVDLELVELLGIGGFGEVWKARNPNRPRAEPVALKFCLDPQAAEALRNEADMLDRVIGVSGHPGIVDLRHTYLSAEPPALEFEYVEGGDLGGLLDEWYRGPEKPTPDKVLRVLLHILEPVAHAHCMTPPIVHRDLKPANVLVRRDSHGKIEYLISDFGLGGLASQQALSHTRRGSTAPDKHLSSAVRGAYTPLYAAPEQIKGEDPTPTDDVYALGVIWYQLLTGDMTRGAPTGLDWPEDLCQRGMNGAQVQLLGSCFASHAAKRPANAAVLRDRLLGTLSDTSAVSPSSTPALPLLHTPGKRPFPMLPFVSGLFLLAIATLAASFIFKSGWLEGSAPTAHQSDTPTQPVVTDTLPREFTNSIGMKFVRIPKGRFTMGAAPGEKGATDDEKPRTTVSVTRSFYLGVYEVTQGEYEQVMGKNPSKEKGKDVDRFPVEMVDRADSLEFCRQLSRRKEENEAKRQYQLPTEAEWEYACRAGSTSAFHYGEVLNKTEANFDGRPKAVGQYRPNAWGLYDMHGNVREWCADGFASWYTGKETRVNPLSDPKTHASGVVRGGGWNDEALDCRSARRKEMDPTSRFAMVGFRVVCVVGD